MPGEQKLCDLVWRGGKGITLVCGSLLFPIFFLSSSHFQVCEHIISQKKRIEASEKAMKQRELKKIGEKVMLPSPPLLKTST